MNAYEILSGVGTLYAAAANTAAPAVNAAPSVSWTDLGETDGGVKVVPTQKIEGHGTDQRTGKVKATRTEETLGIETSLAQATLENLAKVMGGQTVTDTPPGVATIGIRAMGFYRGGSVDEFALLFRASSPYGDYPAQYYIPRGYFDGDNGMEYKKGPKVMIPVKFEALEDLNAGSEEERFGVYTAQDAAVTG
jgi:hypothetical protein